MVTSLNSFSDLIGDITVIKCPHLENEPEFRTWMWRVTLAEKVWLVTCPECKVNIAGVILSEVVQRGVTEAFRHMKVSK
jgi:hypothetical protein